MKFLLGFLVKKTRVRLVGTPRSPCCALVSRKPSSSSRCPDTKVLREMGQYLFKIEGVNMSVIYYIYTL
jgi:hypothetical protein